MPYQHSSARTGRNEPVIRGKKDLQSPLAQSPDAQPETDADGGRTGDWHVAGADSPDDVEEPSDRL